jgi:hypothetical protein
MTFPQLVGILIGSAFGLTVGGLLGSFFLIISARWSQKIKVDFENAFITVVLSIIASVALGGFVAALLDASRASVAVVDSVTILMIPAGLLVHGSIIGARLKVSLGRGILVALTMSALWIGVGIVVALIVFIITSKHQ